MSAGGLAARLRGDAAWVLAGQIVTALGTLLGIRLLTEVCSRETFGELTLCLGVSSLVLSISCLPLAQAALHFYPELQQRGAERQLLPALAQVFRRIAPWLAGALLVLALLYLLRGLGSPSFVPLLLLLFACDGLRTVQTSLLNAARRHRRYALWMAAEACLRPIVAVLAVRGFGESVGTVLAAYLLVSACLLGLLTPRARQAANTVGDHEAERLALGQRIGRYVRPLFPLGLVDWTNGVADRYLIGGLLSVGDAGVYAAAYGLASRPFQMLGGSVELALRPLYQAAVSAGERERAQRLLRLWLLTVSGIGLFVVAALSLLREPLADLLLGARFRSGAQLMPWIGLGYCLLSIAQLYQRICYAHGDTRAVLLIQASAAAVGLIATAIGAWTHGLIGAAIAVPVCFAAQLLVSLVAARRTTDRHDAVQVATAPG